MFNANIRTFLAWGLGLMLSGVFVPLVAAATVGKGRQPVEHQAANGIYQDVRYPERVYRQFTLPNGLKVVIVSDPTIQKAAASLIVRTGSMSDPKDAQGLAHFLEHMLFLGTQQYPEVNEFQIFLSAHGGSSNAYTAPTHTNYFFEVNPKVLQGALNRYAQFFISPLFTKEYLRRELNAVNSEHQKNIPSDTRRIHQLMKVAYIAGHPAKQFATGNIETLRSVTREQIIDFYHKHYSSNLMQLVVVGNQSTSQLSEWIKADFSAIKNRQLTSFHAPKVFLAPSKKFRLLTVKSVKDIRQLQLIFPTPPIWQDYKSDPMHFLSFLFGHEGQGSLLSRLKKLGLANGLAAGVPINTRWYSSLDLTVSLTKKGLKHYKEVISQVFDYAKLLKHASLPKYVYDEVKTMQKVSFQFAPKTEAERFAIGLNQSLRFYPLTTMINGALISEYNPGLFNALLKKVNPNNMLVILAHKDVKGAHQEPFYGINYTYVQADDKTLKDWQHAKGDALLTLPKANPFIPKKLKLIPPQSSFTLDVASIYRLQNTLHSAFPHVAKRLLKQIKRHQNEVFSTWAAFLFKVSEPHNSKLFKQLIMDSARVIPISIQNNSAGRVLFVQARRFNSPKAALVLRILTPKAYDNAKDAVLTALYVKAMTESLNEYNYMAQMAGLAFSVSRDKKGINLTFYGYSDRLLYFARTIIGHLKNVSIDKASFQRIKDQTLRTYQNFPYSPSFQQGFYYAMAAVEPHRFLIDEYVKVLPTINYEMLKAFPRQLYRSGYWQGMLIGNLNQGKAKHFTSTLSHFIEKPYPKKDHFKEQMILLPKGKTFLYARQTPLNIGSSVTIYQLGKATPALGSALAMINTLLGPQFYTELRTEQQLGYTVFANQATVNHLLMEYFVVQSKSYLPQVINQRVSAFVPSLVPTLTALTPMKFVELKSASINNLIQRPKTQLAEAKGLFDLRFKKNKPFDLVAIRIKALLALKPKDVLQLYQRYFIQQPRRIIVNLYAKPQAMPQSGSLSVKALKKNYPCQKYCIDSKK